MALTEQDFERAAKRMTADVRSGQAIRARYDRHSGRIVVGLSTGVQIAFPVRLVESLAGASVDQLSEIEISVTGLGLHWPRLDADLYVPGLMQGIFGPQARTVAELGAAGGRVTSVAKALAARENGRKGGRPRRKATG